MMNVKSNVNVKIDADIKEMATQILARMGIDQTTAIDMYFRQIIKEKRLPFQPAANLTLDDRLIAALEKSKPKVIELQADKNGNVIIDKEIHPDLYDWAVNG